MLQTKVVPGILDAIGIRLLGLHDLGINLLSVLDSVNVAWIIPVDGD
jgi:hypothetical protein